MTNVDKVMASKRAKQVAVAVMMASVASVAMAGDGGTFMNELLNFLVESLTGAVGKVIGLAGILYGLVAGIKNGSLAGFGVGVGLAVGAYYGPDIIEAMAPAALVIL